MTLLALKINYIVLFTGSTKGLHYKIPTYYFSVNKKFLYF